MPDSNYLILVGFGQVTRKSDDAAETLEPIELAAEAARRAVWAPA